MIKDWLALYNPANKEEVKNALREILQEIALAGLYRAGFYKYASFYGGTALRIFYGLPRFSEDLDFSLLKKDPNFDFKPFLSSILDECRALGLEVSLREKPKVKESNIESAFLKSDTLWRELDLLSVYPGLGSVNLPSIKIKLEVDVAPPLGFKTENRLIIRPFSFYVNCFSLPSLFAGKMHAILFRKWINRSKGRDWFDLEWYIQRGVELDLVHFNIRAMESNDLTEPVTGKQELLDLLNQRILAVDFPQIKNDILRFLPSGQNNLALWGPSYFNDLSKHLKLKS